MRRGERAWAGWGWHREDWRCGGRGGGASTRPHASRRGAHTHLLARARALTTRHTGSPPHPRHAGIPRAPQKPITRVDCCLPRPMRRLTNDKHMSDEPTLMSFENLHVLGHTCLAARLGGARAECDCGEALTPGPPPPLLPRSPPVGHRRNVDSGATRTCACVSIRGHAIACAMRAALLVPLRAWHPGKVSRCVAFLSGARPRSVEMPNVGASTERRLSSASHMPRPKAERREPCGPGGLRVGLCHETERQRQKILERLIGSVTRLASFELNDNFSRGAINSQRVRR